MNNTPIYEERAGYHCLTHINHQTNDLYLCSFGTQKCPPGHFFGPDSRPEYHLHVILDGEGFFEINNKKYHLTRGQIFLCPPNTIVHYYADDVSPWYYAWVSFHGLRAADYLKLADFDENHLIRNSNVPPENFTAIIHEMLKCRQLNAFNELKQIAYLYHFIALLLNSNSATFTNKYNHYDYSSSTYVEHAKQYIAINYNADLHVSDIAAYIGINRSYLCNCFKKKLNQSPQEYLIQFRMDKTKELLASTVSDIKTIANQVGYKDPLTFSKAFHRTVGCSPTDYRRNISV